jgi:DNA polymerase-3 subunit epsilon
VFYLEADKIKQSPKQSRPHGKVPDWPATFKALAQQAQNPLLKRFYDAGVVAPDTPLQEVPLIAMDFETTGIDASRDDIVSIGLVPMTLQRIRLAEARHWIVKPRASLREESVVIHRITHSEIETAPDLGRILDELLEIMAGHLIVVHHRGIERSFLDAALKKRIGEGIIFPVIDTMELEARLHRRRRPGLISRLLGQRPESIRLPESRTRYHLPHYHAHHALTDALACAELLQAQVAHRFSPQTPVHQLWR